MRSKAALPLAQCGSAALSRALVVSLCLRELTSLPTLLESADYRELMSRNVIVKYGYAHTTQARFILYFITRLDFRIKED